MHGPRVGKLTKPWPEAREQLEKSDAVLDKALLAVQKEVEIRIIEDPFAAMMNTFCHQQIGMEGGANRFDAFYKLCTGKDIQPDDPIDISAEDVVNTPAQAIHDATRIPLEQCVRIRDFAEEILSGRPLIDFRNVGPEEVWKYFKDYAVKGFKEWSTQYFLVYCCADPDTFLDQDVSLINSMTWAYGLKGTKKERRRQMRTIAENWSPHRAAAGWYIYNYWVSQGRPKPEP